MDGRLDRSTTLISTGCQSSYGREGAISDNRARRIIVNADDFGLSPAVNRGILAAHRRGILTSATLLANAPAFDQAVDLARAASSLGVGAHLNLVRGKPLSPPESIPLLVDGDGMLRRFRVGRLTAAFLDQAEREYRAQLNRIVKSGITPTHIDFEKHHAWQGPFYRLAVRLAGEFGIHAVRSLREPVAWSVRTLGWPGFSHLAMATFLRVGFDCGGGRGLARTPDRFLGQCHIGRMDETTWLRLAERLPPGTSEVMTHPGEEGEEAMGGSWLGSSRAVELAALLSPRVAEALRRNGVELITFAAL
ncbi:MAG: ChbG/HpnK family deacetylase [Planctomycetaceae bacterium]|nr:ChbG/HpnK family deacetylase [Planctomycetaceae bacterium]